MNVRIDIAGGVATNTLALRDAFREDVNARLDAKTIVRGVVDLIGEVGRG